MELSDATFGDSTRDHTVTFTNDIARREELLRQLYSRNKKSEKSDDESDECRDIDYSLKLEEMVKQLQAPWPT